MSNIGSRARRFVPALFVVIGLGWSVEARADKVDWSEYLEPPGAKPPVARSSAKPAAAPRATKQSTAKKRTKPSKPAKLARAKRKR